MSTWLAAQPLILIAVAAIAVMLAVAYRRSFPWAAAVAAAGLLASAVSLGGAGRVAPLAVTGLIRIDAYALFFFGVILLSAAAVMSMSFAGLKAAAGEREEYLVLLLTATLGAMLLVASTHFASFFLGLELLSVSLFPMIAYRAGETSTKAPADSVQALEAGVKYLMLSGLASALLLFGIALVYSEFGLLDFDRIGQFKAGLGAHPLALIGVVLIAAALAFKLSLAPFHLWTADVYQGAAAPVAAFIATVSKLAVFALLLRLAVSTRLLTDGVMSVVLAALATVSILAGNLLALRQTNLKRLLAYSSIAHMGYVVVLLIAGIAVDRRLLVEAVAFYLLAYALATLLAFGVIAGHDGGERQSPDDYGGLIWRDAGLGIPLLVALLSLAGIPVTGGFIAKFYVFVAGVQGAYWALVGLVIVGSGIGLYYYLRVAWMLMQPGPDASEPLRAKAIVLMLGALLLIAMGVAPQWVIAVLPTL